MLYIIQVSFIKININIIITAKHTTRRDAISAGMKRYFTGKQCISGHIAERLVANGGCLECKRIHPSNSDEKFNARHARYRKKNAERIRQMYADYRKNNPEKRKQQTKKWRDKNPHKLIEYAENRNGYIKIAKPLWADDHKIKAI